jgi:putative SbcD/Mre11-related phosphoesterase
MNRVRLELEPGLVLDARRALWLAAERTLAVADLHVGYVWAQRETGQLLPLSTNDKAADRLLALAGDYEAQSMVLLGDIIHAAVPLPELRAELADLFARLCVRVAVTCVGGNHDRQLARLFRECGIDLPLVREHRVGPHRLLHGDGADLAAANDGFTIIGHEHPAINLSDGVAHSVRCPCFLVGPGLIVLPAFSKWAAGGNVRGGHFMSPLAQTARFEKAVAIIAGKLLPIPVSIGAANACANRAINARSSRRSREDSVP